MIITHEVCGNHTRSVWKSHKCVEITHEVEGLFDPFNQRKKRFFIPFYILIYPIKDIFKLMSRAGKVLRVVSN